MARISLLEKFKQAAGVICRQGLIQFPVTDTAVTIIQRVVGNSEDELDLIYAFREKPSQTIGPTGRVERILRRKNRAADRQSG